MGKDLRILSSMHLQGQLFSLLAVMSSQAKDIEEDDMCNLLFLATNLTGEILKNTKEMEANINGPITKGAKP